MKRKRDMRGFHLLKLQKIYAGVPGDFPLCAQPGESRRWEEREKGRGGKTGAS